MVPQGGGPLTAPSPPAGTAPATPADEALATAHRVLGRVPLVDGHNDLPHVVRTRAGGDLGRWDPSRPTDGHTDFGRLRRGRVGAQFWAAYVPCEDAGPEAPRIALEQAELVRAMVERYPDHLAWAASADDIEAAFARGRIASLLGVEGGHALRGSLGVLRAFHRLGARYLTLTHNCSTPWADSATGARTSGGLSDFGEEVVGELNRLGMMVDLSHVSPETMRDALAVSRAPAVFTHSSARALTDHPRNVPDDVLERVGDTGGLVMVTFVPRFVSEAVRLWEGPDSEAPRATLSDVADHVEHVRRVAGVDHVGLGGDFDGTPVVTEGLDDVSCYPALFAELARRGWTERELEALAGRNLLRVMREVEAVARGTGGTAARRSVGGPTTKGDGMEGHRGRRPGPGEHTRYFARYVDLVPDGDVADLLETGGRDLVALLRSVPAGLEDHRYADGKWSVREVVGHVIDAERVFAFRALHVARGAGTPLPSMEENDWAESSNAGVRPLPELADELASVRASTVALVRGLAPEAMDRTGTAGGNPVSVRALVWIIAGHALHHRRILEERYLSGAHA